MLLQIRQYMNVLCGFKRGPCGETPLLLALLYSQSQAYGDEDVSKRVWKESNNINTITCLWDDVPVLRSLPYNSEEYYGENVLHMAIANRNVWVFSFFKTRMMSMDTDSNNGTLKNDLLEQKASGKFHSVGAHTLDFGDSKKRIPVSRYGQHPLC